MVYFIRWSFFSIGLIFFSMGIVLAINVQYLGVQSWDVLHVALNNKFGLTIGSWSRSEEHTSELQSRGHLVCRLLLEKKKISFYYSATVYAESDGVHSLAC